MRLGVLDVGPGTAQRRAGPPGRAFGTSETFRPHPRPTGAGLRSLAPGAHVAEAAMRDLRVTQLEICQWASPDGVILRRPDPIDGTAQIDRSAQDAPSALGRLTTYEARCTG